MLPYFLFLFAALLFGYLAFKNKERHNRFWLIMLFLLMTLFAGLRSSSVGTDSGNYAFGFEDQRYISKSVDRGVMPILLSEPGFTFLQKTVGHFSTNYNDLFLAIAATCALAFLYMIATHSPMPLVSLFVYITLGYYTFVFNGARQGIAIAIYLLAVPSLIKHDFWSYLLFVLLASLFHNSALIAIPLYFILIRRYSFKNLALIIVSGIIVAAFLPRVLAIGSLLNEKIAGYGSGSTGGYVLAAFYVILTVFFLSQRRVVVEDAHERYDVYLNMMVVGSVIYVIVSATGAYSELTRFAAYFQIASVFLWAEIGSNRSTPMSIPALFAALAGHIFYYTVSLMQFGNLVPYSVNLNYIDILIK